MAIALTGYYKTNLSIIEKVLFAAGGVMLVMTKVHFVIIGAVFIALVYLMQKRKDKAALNSI